MNETHKWGFYDFEPEINRTMHRCSECGRVVPRESAMWVSRAKKNTKYVAKGAVCKRVCSVECGQTFDYHQMLEQANKRADIAADAELDENC